MAIFNTVYGGEWSWKPGSNTIAYYKFDGNLNDSSGNNRNATNSGTISYNTSPNAVVLSNSSYLSISNMSQFTTDWTMSYWVYRTANAGSNNIIYSQGSPSTRGMVITGINTSNKLLFGFYADDHTGTTSMELNKRYNLVFTYNYTSRQYIGYISGSSDLSGTLSAQYSVPTTTGYIGALANTPTSSGYRYIGKLSEFIIEDKARTAEEVAKYYNSTKVNYS